MMKNYDPSDLAKAISKKLLRTYGKDPETASDHLYYKATCLVVRDIMNQLRQDSLEQISKKEAKQVFYFSMEFLPGPSLKNNAYNLGLSEALKNALSSYGKDFDEICKIEPDAGLGNGGLGRLASCYLDALASEKMAGHGFSICYQYGIFKQKIIDGEQKEFPDEWMDLGGVWLVEQEDEVEEIHLGGKLHEYWGQDGKMHVAHTEYKTVLALPRDLLITGYDSPVVNTLRLWQAVSPVSIDMELFAEGQYLKAMEEKHLTEVISKILYPEDAHREGKELRITQQYFFIAASMQTIVKRHLKEYGTFSDFPDKVSLHINDTHPTMVIPELMRVFMDEYDMGWDEAWDIVTRTVSYTNHTIMPEALEKWPEDLFQQILPRLHSIVWEINKRQSINLMQTFPNEEALRNEMAIIHNGQLRMANLCVEASHSVNGVSTLHSGIIKDRVFNGFYRKTPDKFKNVTNGIAYRRWLCQANPLLSGLLDELIGPAYRSDASQLEGLLEYADDSSVLERLADIKRQNKIRLADYIEEKNGVRVDIDSIFDVQVKRLHEYKRQLLNIFHIIHLYNRIKNDPNVDIQPRTFIFGAKAAAGYYMAKEIIKLASAVSRMVEKDPDVRGRIKVIFLENYSVSLSELIMPAAEISEQISLAGKEASGTGNMKLMINGALTIGTEDGANVEIHQALGDENIFIFGMKVDEVEQLVKRGDYSSWALCHSDRDLDQIIRRVTAGIDKQQFGEIINSLTTGYNGTADVYFVLKDFASYKNAQDQVAQAYRDKQRWNRMSLHNIAKAGIFSADRSVAEYAENIWHIQPIY